MYPSDAELFKDRNWLNDACISYCFRRIEDEVNFKSIIFMDPSVVSFMMLQAIDDDENDELAISLSIKLKRWIIVPINDNDSFASASTHWSLLLCNINSGFIAHFDSNNSYNFTAACKAARRIRRLLHMDEIVENNGFIQVKCSQQENGYDCGMYVVIFTLKICKFLSDMNKSLGGDDSIMYQLESIVDSVSPRSVSEYRQQTLKSIHELTSKYRK